MKKGIWRERMARPPGRIRRRGQPNPEPRRRSRCRRAQVEGRPLPESELVERARKGDQRAYGDLVQAYQGIAFRTAYLVVGDAGEAEEAAQEGFVKAFRALHRFRPGAPYR